MNLTPQTPIIDYPMRSLWYGPPKVGKTVATSLLPGHYIMELERSGAAYCTAAHDVYPTRQAFDAGLAELEKLPIPDRPKFLGIDTADRLEDIAVSLAVEQYNKRFPKAKLQSQADLFGLDYGLGYGYLREAFRLYLDAIQSLGIPTLFLAHVRPKFMDKEARETSTEDLALTGRVRDILCAEVDLIGFLTRNKKGELLVATRTSDTINCGCRLSRLSGREIVLVETKDGKLVANWKEIFPQVGMNSATISV